MTQYAPRLVRLPIPAAIVRSFAAVSLLLPGLALAGPTGGVVVGGQATIGNPSPTSTVIHQGSNSAIINWQQFNIGGNEYVQFIQPSSSSVVLNRVIGGSPSEIFGSLSANGRVFLINPNGVLFAPGAQLDVGGLVASTMNIKDADFLSGHYVFAGGSAPGSSVVNGGTIKTGNGGFVVLAGDYVKNTGIIQAKLGQVVLASGSATTLELGNSGLVSFAVDKATLAQKAGVDNAGQIIADGGRVIMTAKTAHDLVGSAVNNTGLVRAQGIASHNGEIELTAAGGDITDSGTLDASNAAGSGGTVAISGDRSIEIQPTAQILASGTTGGKIRVVADGTLATAAGSSIEARGTAGKGGAAELSGHGKLTVRGNVNLGSGGTLLIDPTDLTIASGTGTGSSATVYEKFVESQLKNNTDVQLVATNSITLANLADGTLDGVNSFGYGGSLLLGIGTLDPNNGYIEGNSGSILFTNTANTISVYGGLRINAGSAGGTVKVGNLIAGNIQVQGLGGVTVGTVTAESGGIQLTSGVGDLGFGALNTKGGGVVVNSSGGAITGGDITTSSGSISVEADAGGIKLGNLSTTYIGSSGGDASVTVRAAAGIEVGSITTDAETTESGSSYGYVSLNANDFGQLGGDLLINGPISTTARGVNSYNDASITLSNNAGSITALGALITHDVGSEGSNDIDIGAYGGGNVTTGALTATNGSIDVTAQPNQPDFLTAGVNANGSGGGNISLGTLSGGGAPGNALNSVTVDAYGGLTVASDISASSINLYAAHGDMKAGNINVSGQAFSVTDYGGNLTFGSVSASDYISLNDVGGDIKTGNLTSLNGSISATTSSGSGNITLGILSGGSGNGDTLSYVNVNAYGGLTIGGTDITAGNINLSADNGNLGAGNLTATRGGITLNDYGGSITVGKLSASASSTDGGASAVITAFAAGGISTGSITTSAQASGGSSNAYIQIEANYAQFSTQLGGDLVVAGPINTNASNSGGSSDSGTSADAGVTLYNGKGGITTGDIDTHASAFAGGLRGNIDLNAFSGNVSTGTLSVIDGGAISVSTNTSGDISVGQLSAPGGGLSIVTLSSAGGLSTKGTGIIADQITLAAANGDLSTGDLTNRVFGLNISDYGGTMTLGTVHSEDGGLALYDSNGGISTGNLYSADNIFITTVGSGGNVRTGTLNANSGTLGILDIESSGGIDIGGSGHAATTAGVVTLNAGNGNVTAGDLTGTYSSVTVSSNNGNILLGKVTADGLIRITSVGTSNSSNDTVVTNGNISTGDLTDTSGNGITVTSSGFGSITVGALSGSTDGSLGAVKLTAAGALKTTGPAITAGSITLSAGIGDLEAGDLTSTSSGGPINITDTNGKITVGTVTARGDIVINDGGGGIQTQDLRANKGAASILVKSTGPGADIKLGALSGGSTDTPLSTVSLISGGSLAAGSSNITAGSITLSAGTGDLEAGDLTSTNPGSSINITDANGKITVGTVTALGNIVIHDGGGGIQTQDLKANKGAASILVTSTGLGANIKLGALSGGSTDTPLGTVSLISGGSLAAGSSDITAGTITLSAGSGSLAFGTLDALTGALSVNNSGGSITLASLLAAGDITLTASGGGITSGNLTAGGDITLGAAQGALAFGNLVGNNIALSTGQALIISSRSINATGGFTLAAGGNSSIANSSIDAGSASLTSSGSLDIANSSVIAQTVTLNASGAIAISGNSVIGTTTQSALTSGLQPRDTATSSISLSSGADISIDQSTLRAVQLALNGKGIHLANGAVLNGTNVVLTGTAAVDAAGNGSSIDAGALSVRGGSIDLTDAVLTIGSGNATFGGDSALLARIHAKDPALLLPTSGPNASFAAAGGVKLGKLSIAGGYLFIEAPALRLPTTLGGNANMFVDFLPTDPAALLNVDLTQPLPGVATLVFGGTPQTGNIQVGDGTRTFALASGTNLVFATSGATLYPDSISSNGAVVVLGDSVLRTPPVDLTDIPLTTDQYTVDAPDTGVLAYNGDQGDINDPGVNDANKGRIDIKTSTQQTLSCGIGGAQ